MSPLSIISLPSPPFQVELNQIYASMFILEEQSLHLQCTLSVGTIHWKNMSKKNVLFKQFMREGFQIQLVKLWKSACQPSSSWQESMPSPPKFASFIQQKRYTASFYCHPIRAPIFVYYSWAASYMRKPKYVGFSKAGADTWKNY